MKCPEKKIIKKKEDKVYESQPTTEKTVSFGECEKDECAAWDSRKGIECCRIYFGVEIRGE